MNPGLMQSFALLEMAISCSLVLMWALEVLRQKAFPLIAKILLLVLLPNLFFWPLGMSLELPLAAYVRGMTGDLSIVTSLLLWSTMLPNNKAAPMWFRAGIAIVALGFYPFALGISMIDPYVWGYGSIPFFIIVLICALICALFKWVKGVWILGIAILAWSFHWHESANLWDYLLDPFVAIWAVISLFNYLRQKRKDKARSGYLFRPG